MGVNKGLPAVGMSTVRIKMHDDVIRILEVCHVPDLKRNLISLSLVGSRGYRFVTEGGVLKVSKGALVVIEGLKVNDVYQVREVYIFD